MNIFLNPAIKKKTNNLSVEIYEHTHIHFGLNEERYAWRKFSGWTDDEYPASSVFMEIFIPWYLYSYVNDYGETFAATYLYEHETRLCDIQKEFINSSISNKYSFYIVNSVEPGRHIQLTDLITKKKCLVFENAGSLTLKRGDIIFTKVAEVANLNFLVGTTSFIIPDKFLKQIQDFSKNRKNRDKEDERISMYFVLVGEILEEEDRAKVIEL